MGTSKEGAFELNHECARPF